MPSTDPLCRVVTWDENGNVIDMPITKENLLTVAQEIVNRLTTEAAT